MSIATGDDADTVGNIEKFLQQCLEGMAHTVKGVGRPRILPAMEICGRALLVLRPERLWQPTGGVASDLGTPGLWLNAVRRL